MEERDTFLGLILARAEQATMRDVKSLDFSFLALTTHLTSVQYSTILHYYYGERTGVAIFSARQSNVFLKYKKRGKLYCSNYCLDTDTETI